MKLSSALAVSLLLVGCPAAEEPDTIENYAIKKITASGVVVDCKGGLYNDGKLTELRIVTSRESVPTDVVVRNCRINGAIRIAGLGMNGESAGVNESSKKAGHTERAQAAAPTRILLENLTINADARIPLYLSPGVTGVTLRNSTLTGKSNSVAIYFDAESARNTLEGNTIKVRTGQSREVIALDGSADNQISGNTIRQATHGGIYLYRNCGEGGTVRHQAPQRNRIEGNSFDLTGMAAGSYGIWLGSRDGNRRYCEDDKGFPFGSSVNNGDFANDNVIKGNSFTPGQNAVRDDGSGNRVEK